MGKSGGGGSLGGNVKLKRIVLNKKTKEFEIFLFNS
jgi:hypothetical protein